MSARGSSQLYKIYRPPPVPHFVPEPFIQPAGPSFSDITDLRSLEASWVARDTFWADKASKTEPSLDVCIDMKELRDPRDDLVEITESGNWHEESPMKPSPQKPQHNTPVAGGPRTTPGAHSPYQTTPTKRQPPVTPPASATRQRQLVTPSSSKTRRRQRATPISAKNRSTSTRSQYARKDLHKDAEFRNALLRASLQIQPGSVEDMRNREEFFEGGPNVPFVTLRDHGYELESRFEEAYFRDLANGVPQQHGPLPDWPVDEGQFGPNACSGCGSDGEEWDMDSEESDEDED